MPAKITQDVRIQAVEPLPAYRLRLVLSDGRTVERDVSDLVPSTDDPDNVITPWRDPAYFAQVRLATDPWPAPTWPNGVDLDPDVLISGVDADGHLLAPTEHAEAKG
jgi:hypothetical protein